MDPERAEDQANALAATRRVLVVVRLEVAGGEEVTLTQQDRGLLEGYDAQRLAEDLRTFAEWHRAQGVGPGPGPGCRPCRDGATRQV